MKRIDTLNASRSFLMACTDLLFLVEDEFATLVASTF
jgi:hypothetical protein